MSLDAGGETGSKRKVWHLQEVQPNKQKVAAESAAAPRGVIAFLLHVNKRATGAPVSNWGRGGRRCTRISRTSTLEVGFVGRCSAESQESGRLTHDKTTKRYIAYMEINHR